jgi:hypothetical protein
MPIPPAIRTTALSRRRAASVKVPNGPSATTRVPGRISAIRLVKSPSALTVIRRESPRGASEIENGCDAHQRPRARNRHRKNWPAQAWRRWSPPGDPQRDDAGALVHHVGHAQPVAERVHHRRDDAKGDQQQQGRDVESAPVVGGDAVEHHRRHLARQRDPVQEGVAPDRQHDMAEHEVEAGVAVPPVPDRQPVEVDELLESGQPREQQAAHRSAERRATARRRARSRSRNQEP